MNESGGDFSNASADLAQTANVVKTDRRSLGCIRNPDYDGIKNVA